MPWLPEAQATFFEMALTPRRLSVVWVGRICGADCGRAVVVRRMIGRERMVRLAVPARKTGVMDSAQLWISSGKVDIPNTCEFLGESLHSLLL